MPRKVCRNKDIYIMSEELEDALDTLVQTLCEEEAV